MTLVLLDMAVLPLYLLVCVCMMLSVVLVIVLLLLMIGALVALVLSYNPRCWLYC